eukprot:Phypoly_transcript_24483.p1 GENE.Phypoly_transcript_24483~~Phypoly_transcript_24483.p1  ORF type:complete len:112 (-),score=4.01 Phypoly_transcript_24483:73-408(-)
MLKTRNRREQEVGRLINAQVSIQVLFFWYFFMLFICLTTKFYYVNQKVVLIEFYLHLPDFCQIFVVLIWDVPQSAKTGNPESNLKIERGNLHFLLLNLVSTNRKENVDILS